MRNVLAATVVVVVVLAGCSDEPAAPKGGDVVVPEDSFDDYALEEVAPQFGVIRGVAVDAALRPLAGVLVELTETGENMTTGDTGVFAFKDVVPGTHFLRASLDGHETVQASVDVAANVPEPEIVRVLLRRLPGTEPRVEVDTFKGFINCAVRIPAAGFNDGCVVFGDLGLGSTQRFDVNYTGTGIQWWQAELVWTAANQFAERLCLRASAETHAGDDICGPVPQVQTMGRDLVVVNDLEEGATFELVAYPDHLLANVSGNLVLQQEFQVIHHVFYNFSPPEGWTFYRDGPPVVPE